MKKLFKIFGILFGLFVVALAGLIVFLKIYLTPERVKAFIIPVAEDALQREVELGELNVSIFKGIQIKDFAIKEEDKKTDFVSTKEFVLTYQLWPLISGNVIIDELKMISPSVRVTRNKNGVFNYESLGKKTTVEKIDEEEKEEAKELPISLRISKLIFKDARLTVKDAKKKFLISKRSFS